MAKSKIWEALVQKTGGQTTPPAHDQMLRDLYGSGPRGGLNTSKASKVFGRSERTIRRWSRDGIPASEAKTLERKHSRWRRETQAGRQSTLGQQQASAIRQQGLTVNYVGKILISGSDPRNSTARRTSFTISPGKASVLLDAAVDGTKADLQAALEWSAADAFGGSVQFVIDDIKFT